jgi:CRP-like cAMP-binding protein/Fe-S-cluster-containing hydrogenase component 2
MAAETAEPKQDGRPNIPIAPGQRVFELEQLKQFPLLSKLSEVTLKKLQPNIWEAEYAAGEIILREGDYNDAAFYLLEGTAEVRLRPSAASSQAPQAVPRASLKDRLAARLSPKTTPPPSSPQLSPSDTVILQDLPVEIRPGARAYLEPGDIFGEMSALSRFPISADVYALTPVRALLIRVPALRLMFKQKDLAEFKQLIDDRYRQRTLGNQIRKLEAFANLDRDAIARLIEHADLASYEPGALIVEEGSPCEALLLVRGGYIKVSVQSGAAELAVTYLRRGDYAGEASLLLSQPWPFSLYALEHVEIVKLPKSDVLSLVTDHSEIKVALWEQTLRQLKVRGLVQRQPLITEYLQMAMDTGLIHGEGVLLIDLNTCTRCDDCVRACADTHEGIPRFVREGSRFNNWHIPVSCYQCTDPVCMIGCPTGAITRATGTLEVTINPLTCIGCGNCVRRCPWDNIIEVPFQSPTLNKEINLATKCDLCVGRKEGPACVQMCPHGSAIRVSFKDLQKVAETLQT